MQYQWENVILQPVTYGEPQGSILLFITYMNDLPLAVDNAEITMHVDDTSMYRTFNNVNSLTDELISAFGKYVNG